MVEKRTGEFSLKEHSIFVAWQVSPGTLPPLCPAPTHQKAQELKTTINSGQLECGLTYIIESEVSFQVGGDFSHYLNQTCKLAQAWRPKA